MTDYNDRMNPGGAHVAAAFSALSGNDVLSAEQLSGGSSNPTWLVTTPKGRYALRFYPYSDSATAYGQAELLSYLAAQSYPVPEVVFVGTYETQYLLALSWVEGATAAEALLAQPEQAERFGRAFGEAHAQLHTVPVTSKICTALQAVTSEPPADTPVLLHLDYHLLNVMTTEGLITGVIDWDNVQLGDARYDVARSLSILCVDPSIRALPSALRQVVRKFRKGYRDGYEQVAGAEAFNGLELFLAWSGHYMLRDLGGRLDSQGIASITRWARWWQVRAAR